MWRKIPTILVSGLTLLALTTATACTPEATNNGQPQPEIPAQRTDSFDHCSLGVGEQGPAAPPPGFFAIQMEAHLYDGLHKAGDSVPFGDEVIKDVRPVTITIDGVAPDGDKADITFQNPVKGVAQKAPVTFSDCPPIFSTQYIKVGMIAVSWTATMPVLTQGWTLSCVTRDAVSPQMMIHSDFVTATDSKIVNATVKCFWP